MLEYFTWWPLSFWILESGNFSARVTHGIIGDARSEWPDHNKFWSHPAMNDILQFRIFFSNWLIPIPDKTTWFEIWIGFTVEVFVFSWNFAHVKLDLNWTMVSFGGHYFHNFWFMFCVPHTTWVRLRHFLCILLFQAGTCQLLIFVIRVKLEFSVFLSWMWGEMLPNNVINCAQDLFGIIWA